MIQHPSCSGSHPACTSKDKIKPRICDPHIRDTVHDSRVAVCGVLGTDSLTLTPAACKEQDGSGRRPLKPFNRASPLYPTSPHVLLATHKKAEKPAKTSTRVRFYEMQQKYLSLSVMLSYNVASAALPLDLHPSSPESVRRSPSCSTGTASAVQQAQGRRDCGNEEGNKRLMSGEHDLECCG